jgi:hypothetical protein
MNFTRGIIILTVLLLSVTVSFFMGRILGNELMAGGKETLEAFTTPGDGDVGSEATLAGTPNQPAYSGPTANKFPTTWGTIEDSEGDAEVVSIETVESSGGGEGEAGMSDLFSLDEGTPEDNQKQFRVQIGVFEHKENGDNLVAALKKEAYPAYTVKVVYEGAEDRWKVYVGPFKTLEAAQAAAEELRVRNYDCYVQ